MTSFHFDSQVEIYVRCEDCHVCGNEINPGREEYIRELRVCPRCYAELRGGGAVRICLSLSCWAAGIIKSLPRGANILKSGKNALRGRGLYEHFRNKV